MSIRPLLLLVVGLLAVLVQPVAPASSAARPDLLPGCVYGMASSGLRGLETRVQRDAWAYADRLTGVTARERLRLARTYAAAEAAYVYGLPLVKVHDTVRKFRFRNTIVSVAALTDPETKAVVSPNVDTAYTVGWLSLTQGPLVIDVPNTRGRFYTIQFMDGYSNSFAYLGSGSTGTRAGSYVLVPPGWNGEVPDGVRIVRSPTRTVWLLGRTVVDDAADMERVKPLLQKYVATPLALWENGVRGRSIVLDRQPNQPPSETPTGTDFIATLNQELTIDPPPRRQRCVLRALAPAGVEVPDDSPAAVQAADAANAVANPRGSVLSTPENDAIIAGTRDARRLVANASARFADVSSAGNRGWSVMTQAWIGDFGTHYLGRAVIATDLLAANVRRIAVYPTSYEDSRGRPLTGRHRYTITFPRGGLPPVRAFWSMTMYQRDNFLYANEIDRYAVGDRERGLRRNADGSLTIYVQHRRPTGAKARANWLPAPAGAFHLIMRLYLPKPSVFSGDYRIPPFVRR
jgi:hypothetical protein